MLVDGITFILSKRLRDSVLGTGDTCLSSILIMLVSKKKYCGVVTVAVSC